LLNFLKIFVFIATLTFIYYKVVKNEHSADLWQSVNNFKNNDLIFLIAAVLLMPLNWILEAVKWRNLLRDLQEIDLITSFKAVWAGLTINNWIPNRMAEFLGRMIFLSKDKRNQSVSCTLTGGMAQFICTVIFGGFSVFFLYSGLFPRSYFFLVVLISLFLLLFYFNLNAFNFITKKIRFFEEYTKVLNFYSIHQLSYILAISAVRYLVYTLQYFLILKVFSVDIPWHAGLTGISVVFLIQALLPSVTLTEIGTRGAAILFVFNRFEILPVNLLLAAYSVWIINIIIPTLFGLLFILRIKSK